MEQPKLDNNGVISLLISADRLKMDAVVEECVQYCYANMEEILLTRNNFSAVNDHLIYRIACKFNHNELEELKDKKDKIKSKLYSKFIERLFRNPPDPRLAFKEDARSLFCCMHCGLLLTNNSQQKIKCIPSQLGINRYGQLVYLHAENKQWDVNHYLKQLTQKLKSWRQIYWHLWGIVNYLKCSFCKEYFRCCDLDRCLYHTDHESLHRLQQIPKADMAYQCCQSEMFLFNPLELKTGCQQRDHAIDLSEQEFVPVYNDLISRRSLICAPAENQKTKTRSRKTVQKQNSSIASGVRHKDMSMRKDTCSPHSKSDDSVDNQSDEEDTYADANEDEIVLDRRLPFVMDCMKATTSQAQKILQWRWNSANSVRYNQDAQREYEYVKQNYIVEKFLNNKGTTKASSGGTFPPIKINGGIYPRLEAEWKSKISPGVSINQRKSSLSNLRIQRSRAANLLSDKRFMSRGEDEHR